ENSTGIDGQQATADITVPSGVMEGPTRMRVVKKFGSTYIVDSCTGTSWGQAEDYTIEVTADGGGGTGSDCDYEHEIAGDGDGGSGSSVDSDFTSAADFVVAAGEDFTLDTIEVSFLTFAPEDAPITANVFYYEDAAGLPGAEIGNETVVPTILSSGEWVNPIAFRFDT
ncbi:GEVED domain-containing protein, partial [Aequorivita marina]